MVSYAYFPVSYGIVRRIFGNFGVVRTAYKRRPYAYFPVFFCIFLLLQYYFLFKITKNGVSVRSCTAYKRALRTKKQVLRDARGEVETALEGGDVTEAKTAADTVEARARVY